MFSADLASNPWLPHPVALSSLLVEDLPFSAASGDLNAESDALVIFFAVGVVGVDISSFAFLSGFFALNVFRVVAIFLFSIEN